jgi:hypothetical protein
MFNEQQAARSTTIRRTNHIDHANKKHNDNFRKLKRNWLFFKKKILLVLGGSGTLPRNWFRMLSSFPLMCKAGTSRSCQLQLRLYFLHWNSEVRTKIGVIRTNNQWSPTSPTAPSHSRGMCCGFHAPCMLSVQWAHPRADPPARDAARLPTDTRKTDNYLLDVVTPQVLSCLIMHLHCMSIASSTHTMSIASCLLSLSWWNNHFELMQHLYFTNET